MVHPTTYFPAGKAQVVVLMRTGSYLGTVVKKFPFTVDNPAYGQPVKELPATGELRAANPGATVIELYGGASLPALGVTNYDGARDVYFARQPNCSGRGTSVNYFSDHRTHLNLGDDGSHGPVLIKFDLGMLPEGVKVKAARLALCVSKLGPRSKPACQVFALKKRWHELMIDPRGGVTGGYSRDALSRAAMPVGKEEPWDKPMLKGPGDRHDGPVATHTFSATGWTQIDVTSAVQNWTTGAWPNHGLVLEAEAGGYAEMWASDSYYDPSVRPRLLLVLEGDGKPRPYKVAEVAPDIETARAQAKAGGKPVLCNILSPGSITSRNFETNVLKDPRVKAYIDANFVEMRISGDDPKHAALLKTYDVRHLPTAVIIPAGGEPGREDFDRIEPLAWNAQFGVPGSCFEFEQSYTALLAKALAERQQWGRFPYRREPDGQVGRYTNRVHGGCKFGPQGGLLKRN